MKTSRNYLAKLICALALTGGVRAGAAVPVEWQHTQPFKVSAAGLVKFSLPIETLDTARPALEDLRLYDDAGNELSFLIQRPRPESRIVQNARSFHVSLNPATTVITLETGVTQPLDGVTLETPAPSFIKPVGVEGSSDGSKWQSLEQGQPIFRQADGASQLHISFPAGVWRWLRFTVDDQRSQPIPFTGARIRVAIVEDSPTEWQPAAIVERNENPGETRLTLNPGAANLDVASIVIETDEPLFTRAVTLAVPQVLEDSIREQVIGQGVIYRIALAGQPVSANLSVPLETRVPSREVVLLIRNQDSPPLQVTAVRVQRRPVYLVFLARQAGTFHLLTGNKFCAAPRYDLAALGGSLKNASVTPVQISAMTANPDYRAPEALAGLAVSGATLDVSEWRFRKPVPLARGGAQQIELDLDVLAHADADWADLRVLRGSNQVPYIVQRTSITRAIKLTDTVTGDAKNPKLSRWVIKLPRAGLPLSRLQCVTKTPLFQREISLTEELTDERGEKYRHTLGNATWTQTPDHKTKEFALVLTEPAQSDTLFLETGNGDNAPIGLEDFTAFHLATRVLFKAQADGRLFLYYGNPRVPPPRYDLSLVAGELLAADKTPAALGAEEQLKKTPWTEHTAPGAGTGGILFWGMLAVVVIGLLVIISRLLPKTTAPS